MIGVIADDLTGAAELAAVGWRHGLRAEVVLEGDPSERADLVCLDTDSRFCDAAEAGHRAAVAARRLQATGAHWLYKKVDSVLRGQVAAEVDAMLRALGFGVAMLGPANPSLGRCIRNGQYFVGGKPIQETEFARDPQHPRRSPNVVDLLAGPPPHVGGYTVTVCGLTRALPQCGIAVLEAGTVGDVQEWARRWQAGVLPAGGAEFFAALLAANGHQVVSRQADPPSTNGRELFVCGTTSESSRNFVRAESQRGTPVVSLPAELARGGELGAAATRALSQKALAALDAGTRLILTVGLPFVSDPVIAGNLSPQLVTLAEAVLRVANVQRIYAEGGATAVALVRRMGWQRLEVVRELAPGVAGLRVGDAALELIMKPGTYVWPKWTERG